MNDKIFKYLSNMPHFSFLPVDELEKVADSTKEVQYPSKTLIVRQGKTAIQDVLIIVKGQLVLYDRRSGERKLSGYIKPGEVFGGITILLNGGISLRDAVADKSIVAYAVPRGVFQDLCTRYKPFYEYFLENFSKNLADPAISTLIETGQARHFLSAVAPFSFLEDDQIEEVAQKLSLVHYPKDTVLFVQGKTRVGYLYILQKGSVERYLENGNRKTMSGILGEGDTYGGISILLNDGISIRTLKVTEDTYFYVLPKEPFLELCRQHESITEFFTDTFGKRMLNRSYASIIAKTLQPKEEDLQIFNQPVESILSRRVVSGAWDLSIREAAQIMRKEKSSFILIQSQHGNPAGIVTERDLTREVIATGHDTSTPVRDIMSSPLQGIAQQALVFEALMAMMDNDIRHLAVTGSDEKVVGMLSNRDIIAAQGQSPLFLLREIAEAETMSDIIDKHNLLPGLIRNLISNGANAQNITRFITTVSDQILKKVMAFTIDALGPPPVRFAFMILGSEGRNEQTLKTDQDNALVYGDLIGAEPSQLERIEEYFLRFGERACRLLDEAGYDYCTGDVMAKNPKWCQPISAWKGYFSEWIHTAKAENLLQASIFFDFRFAYGDRLLVEELRTHLFDSLGGWPGFLRHLTENALYFKPPIGFFRNFVVESKGKHRNAFDIKHAIMPIVDFARIYSLQHKIEETNTLQRLHQLYIKKVLSQKEYEELEKAYSFLMQLRFVRQVTAAMEEKVKPDNYINPKKLTNIEQTMLKEIFKRIEKFQAKLTFTFIGMT
jgi:CBS domain-containing protein